MSTASFRRAGGQPDSDHLIGWRREHLRGHAARRHAMKRVVAIAASRSSCAAIVATPPGHLGEVEQQVAQDLIWHLLGRRAMQRFVGQRLGFGDSGSAKISSRTCGKAALRRRVDRIIRPARPQRVLVELQPIRAGAAEHHRAEPPLPTGSASVQTLAGWRYHSIGTAGAPSAAAPSLPIATATPDAASVAIVSRRVSDITLSVQQFRSANRHNLNYLAFSGCFNMFERSSAKAGLAGLEVSMLRVDRTRSWAAPAFITRTASSRACWPPVFSATGGRS